jgi:hypothetical protein
MRGPVRHAGTGHGTQRCTGMANGPNDKERPFVPCVPAWETPMHAPVTRPRPRPSRTNTRTHM